MLHIIYINSYGQCKITIKQLKEGAGNAFIIILLYEICILQNIHNSLQYNENIVYKYIYVRNR